MSTFQIILRILAAAIIGALIGYEREHHGHPAGIKTHIMVCVGSAIVAITQILIVKQYPGTDMTRIISQVVSGVGFIGAGCILHDRGSGTISGLTTASTLWLTACVGIASGLGYYMLCFVSTFLVVALLYLFYKIRKKDCNEQQSETI